MKKIVLSTMAVAITSLLMVNNVSRANKGNVYEHISSDTAGSRHVVFNEVRLSDEEVYNLEQTYHIKIFDGSYWYDTLCGAWGIQGGPCMGLGQPGLKIGGSLKANASNGNTGVFVNGRQLNFWDVRILQLFMIVIPGRYWLNASGDFGYEGSPMRLGNFRDLVLRAGGNASNTVYSKIGTLTEVGFTGNTIGGQDPYLP